jgi:hypothetical protein
VAAQAAATGMLSVVMIGPSEVLVLMVITAVIVFLIVRRGRVK